MSKVIKVEVKKIYLKDYYSFLGENGCNPTLTAYIQYNMSEMKWENKKRPTLLVCPGGGYCMCSERESEPIALAFMPLGMNVFVLDYSVAPNKFPTQIREVAAAMELLYEKQDEWHIDTEKITIIGFSAGGHLAAHYSTSYDIPEVREVFPQSKAVNGSILSYPVIIADKGICHEGSFRNLDGEYPLSEEKFNRFSLDKCVGDKTPPAFIWHTAADTVVPVQSSLYYAEALSKYKIPYELHIYPYGGHGGSTFDKQTLNEASDITKYNSRWVNEASKWLKLMNLL